MPPAQLSQIAQCALVMAVVVIDCGEKWTGIAVSPGSSLSQVAVVFFADVPAATPASGGCKPEWRSGAEVATQAQIWRSAACTMAVSGGGASWSRT